MDQHPLTIVMKYQLYFASFMKVAGVYYCTPINCAAIPKNPRGTKFKPSTTNTYTHYPSHKTERQSSQYRQPHQNIHAPAPSVTSSYHGPPGFDHPSPTQSTTDDNASKSRCILDSAGLPSHTPVPLPNLHPTKTNSYTQTATGAKSQITHTGKIKINKPIGPLTTTTFV